MRRTVPPSAEIEKRIDELLAGGVGAGDAEGPLSELAKLGAKLIIQRAASLLTRTSNARLGACLLLHRFAHSAQCSPQCQAAPCSAEFDVWVV